MHTRTMGNLEKEMAAKLWWKQLLANAPLMYDKYNLCEKAHINQLFFLQKQFAQGNLQAF